MASWFGGGKKKEEPQMQPAPQIAPAEPVNTEDPERVKRIGRSSLISTSNRGVLGNATTSGKKLSV